jgi:uncharacterized protein (TIGR03083 family)
MDQTSYLASLGADAALLREAARRDLLAPAPSCPGWTTGHLLVHVGQAYNWIGEIVATRTQEPTPIRPADHACDRADPGLFGWFDRSLAAFAATLAAVDPAEPVWTWSRDRRAGFWLRLMAHETALHRWDAQLAHGDPAPVASEAAHDYVDFTLEHWLSICRAESSLPARGESYHLHRTDGAGEWTVRFLPDTIALTREHAKGDVALRGTAADLYLFLWHRLPADRLDIFGDRAILDRYFALVPPQ